MLAAAAKCELPLPGLAAWHQLPAGGFTASSAAPERQEAWLRECLAGFCVIGSIGKFLRGLHFLSSVVTNISLV